MDWPATRSPAFRPLAFPGPGRHHQGMHTLLVIDFWVLLAALAVAFGVSLLTGACRRRRFYF